MKKKRLYQFFAIALALAFVGCSHDELTDGNSGTGDNNSKEAVYMNVTVQLPVGTGTRSTTTDQGGSSDGTEVGLPNENNVTSVLLVLADTDNKLIGCAEKSESLNKESEDKVTTVQSISKSVLSAYYGTDGTLDAQKKENKINVFVFCNPTDALRRIFEGVSAGDETWHEQICTISEVPNGTSDNAAIWGGSNHQGDFLMSSYETSEKELPTKFSDWDKFTTEENPFKLSGNNTGISGSGMQTEIDNNGAIRVERSVARFDFKDGSGNSDNPNTYNVIYDREEATNCIVQIQLQRMALVNMSKNFYYLRRVSDNGLSNGTNYKLCGIEKSSNYVVDTDAGDKNDGNIISGNKYSEHFNFCLGHTPENEEWTIDATARGQWFSSKISSVLGGTEDNPDWTGVSGDYRIWRYVTENTIPGAASNQVTGISTGIVFKGKMIAAGNDTESPLYKALTSNAELSADDPILYAYGSDLFVRWTEVRAMAIKQGTISPMYKAVFGTPQNVTPAAAGADGKNAVYSDDTESPDAKWNAWYNQDKNNSDKLGIFKAAATKAGFTIYERSDDGTDDGYGKGYYCYYFYWNRHNDNGNPSVMNPMEFAIVRNNVYKLAVTSIKKLGHPRISENDPDPVDPEDPDEEGDVYLNVSVEVLPWVVRVNNIDF